MRYYIFIITLFFYSSSCIAQKQLLVLGTKFKQKDLCAELGFAKNCNPFPYGTSLVLQERRWPFPTKEKSEQASSGYDSVDIEDIAHMYIGGIMVNQNLPVPATAEIQNEFKKKNYLDIHKASVNITLKDSIVNTFNVRGSLDNIIAAASAGQFNSLKKFVEANTVQLESELEEIYKRIKNQGVRINLVYHSIKLNGSWYSDVLAQETSAISLLDNTKLKNDLEKNTYTKNDQLAYIGGMGIIEYDVTSIINLDKDFNLGINKTFENMFKIQVKRELERAIEKIVPSKYDLVFVSLLAKTY